jgi:hypothetical protein
LEERHDGDEHGDDERLSSPGQHDGVDESSSATSVRKNCRNSSLPAYASVAPTIPLASDANTLGEEELEERLQSMPSAVLANPPSSHRTDEQQIRTFAHEMKHDHRNRGQPTGSGAIAGSTPSVVYASGRRLAVATPIRIATVYAWRKAAVASLDARSTETPVRGRATT